MTVAALTATDLHLLAIELTRRATDLGAQLTLAEDIGEPRTVAMIEAELDQALREEAFAWEAVTERECAEFESERTHSYLY